MDIILLLKVIWRKKWIILAVPIIAAAAAWFFLRNSVDLYVASAQISTGFTTNDQITLTEEKFNAREADIKFSNLLNSMNSGIATNLVSYRLLLHDLEGKEEPFHRPTKEKLPSVNTKDVETLVQFLRKKIENISPLSTSDPEYSLVHKYFSAYGYGYSTVKQFLSISRIVNTDFIEVNFKSDNPNLSAYAANSFCEEFIRYYKSLKTERTGESVEFLKQLVEEKKADLDEKLETQKIFKSNNGLMDIQQDGGQLATLESQRDEIKTQIHRLELTRNRLNDELRATGSGTTSTTPTNTSNQRIIYLRDRINRLNEQYITGGSSNQVLLDSLNRLREQLRIQMEAASEQLTSTPSSGMSPAELRSKLKDADIEYQVEKSNLSLVEAKIRNLQFTFSGHASKEAKLNAIQKEVDLSSQEYLTAVEKYNEAKNRLLATNSLRQTIEAIPPAGPESSKKMLIIGLAAFSSMAICFFVIVGLELVDLSIKSIDKFKRIVNLPLAGTINKVESKNFNIRHAFSPAGSNDDTEMYKSLLRKLRHEIENLNSKVILFTSPKKKDGKTFVIFSLAYVLSLINKRVLIIDTNFKNNSLSQILAKPQGELKVIDGKKNLLIGAHGQKKREDTVDDENDYGADNTYDLINPTKYKNIYIIGNGGGDNESPAEILSGRNFNNLIEVLSESFDYILMEGASLNDYSDTKELVRYADKVVAVFSAESSIKTLDKESINYFKSLGNKFGGSVLNRVDTKDLQL